MQDYATGGMLMLDPQTDTAIADAVAAVHSLNWPVVEPDRLRGVLERGKAILDLSRRNWEAILAETDDQRELVPSPNQTPIVPEGAVTDEVVAAWHATLDAAEGAGWRAAAALAVQARLRPQGLLQTARGPISSCCSPATTRRPISRMALSPTRPRRRSEPRFRRPAGLHLLVQQEGAMRGVCVGRRRAGGLRLAAAAPVSMILPDSSSTPEPYGGTFRM